MTESFNWSGEAERRAAIEEVTKLRRELKTETAKGAKAAKSDPRFIAAQQRLDAAKSAVGMRTAAEDLAALNKTATSDTATMKRTPEGRMTAAPTRAERAVTKELNAPSKQYFRQVQQALKNPNVVPGIEAPKQITPEQIQEASNYNVNLKNARYDWVWTENPETGKGRWALGIIGALENPPTSQGDPRTYVGGLWRSDSATLKEVNAAWKNATGGSGSAGYIENTNPQGRGNIIYFDDLETVLPDIKYSEYQEVIYRLTLEKDEDITVEDIINKYNELYGEG
jgi:hypothetical protein